ncbi:MAG TPA: 3-hydroxyacyl-CoA dehydrogenase NAD-binding domain-containing protein [Solirubrobacterales bacterium]|nr:3-hydroxyacyl-CoA dehydrogenase NAD-binding domain-containing protein [Solirubrobacterales bacterium]
MSVERIGVAGAGTMGAGIAQVACLGGLDTHLHDPSPEAREAGERRLREALAKGAERGRWSEPDAKAAGERLHASPRLEDLAGCELVIEAAPEELELKRELFRRLAEVCGDRTILATNTSSLQVTAIGAAVPRPERIVGMHFFNPPALMRLVEIVAGEDSAEEALETATAVVRRMGREPVRAADGPGFLANRVARPFGLEALRLLGDGISTVDQIDRIVRLGGGFRMGPFELMDLVGVDVGFEVSKSFYEQSFYEPRWQPHPIQERMVQAGRHGRKVGRGYYEYGRDSYRPDDPEPPEPQDEAGTPADGAVVERSEFVAIPLASGSLASLDMARGSVGYYVLPPIAAAPLVELTRVPGTSDSAVDAAERFFRGLGKHVEWVGDSPGLVLGRVVCQVINEAAFALQARVGSVRDIDTAMRLGFNYPRGPLEWAERIGLEHVLTVLDGLWTQRREERYRASPLLRDAVAAGQTRLFSPTPKCRLPRE